MSFWVDGERCHGIEPVRSTITGDRARRGRVAPERAGVGDAVSWQVRQGS
jgi:hypothetical protein